MPIFSQQGTDIGCLGNLLFDRLTGSHMILTEYQPYEIAVYPKMNKLKKKLEWVSLINARLNIGLEVFFYRIESNAIPLFLLLCMHLHKKNSRCEFGILSHQSHKVGSPDYKSHPLCLIDERESPNSSNLSHASSNETVINIFCSISRKENKSKIYTIPAGGSCYRGTFAYFECFNELIDQVIREIVPPFSIFPLRYTLFMLFENVLF